MTKRSAFPTFSNWMDLTATQAKFMMDANETIARRMSLMNGGTMTPVESMKMVFEKPTAFFEGYERAAVAAAAYKPPHEIYTAFMAPFTKKASSNAKRLRG